MQHSMRHIAALAAILIPSTVSAQTHIFDVALDGRQEVPANTSKGVGNATVVLDQASGAVRVSGYYRGLTGNRSAQHVHAAPAGLNGGVVFALAASGAQSGTFSGSGTLTAAQVTTMLNGGMYINVHSSAFPGGEIRGQIVQCQLYYKFDRGLGDVAVNYGSFAQNGTLAKLPATLNPFAPATAAHPSFKTSLRGTSNASSTQYNYCDTGWKSGITGDMTVSWWMKQRVVPGTALSYLWGGNASWRLFTNGVAGTGLWMRNWSGGNFDVKYPGNVQTLAARAQGVHITLTIDGTKKVAQWYTDGAPTGTPIVIPNGMNVAPATSTFKIGKHTSNTNSSAYDLDEFRLCNRLASPVEIRGWASSPSAGSGPLGTACGLTHESINGRPTLGNTDYAMTISGPATGFRYLFAVGGLRTAPFDMGVVFPALKGCLWYTRFDAQVIGATRAGLVTIPTPVPPVAALAGVQIDTQVLGFDGAKALQSNAMSHAIERN